MFVNVVEQFCRVLVERTTEYVKKVGEINKEIRNGDLGKKERSGVNI